MTHSRLARSLGERLKRREVSSIVYFHTDHFEPWRSIRGEPAVSEGVVESLHDFLRVTERMDFARRLTLFYKPHLNYFLHPHRPMMRAHPDDLVGFLPREEFEERLGRLAMRSYAENSEHEIQLHVHHEYYTATPLHTNPAAVEWFKSPLGRSLDEQRFDLALQLNREIVARETGKKFDKWFFIHGQWALNASDDCFCKISNEIAVLQRHGCLGDFTFPAPVPKVNPRAKMPFLCIPVGRPKGYDLPEAEAEPASGNRVASAQKFFIWSCRAKGQHCSLDYLPPNNRRRLAHTEIAAKALIDGSYVTGNQLFMKTYAHSMAEHYFETADIPIFPHQHPSVQTLLKVIFEAAAGAGLAVEFLTASEVYNRILDMPKDKEDVEAMNRPGFARRLFRLSRAAMSSVKNG